MGIFHVISNRKIVPQTHSAKIACVWDKVILDTVPTTQPIMICRTLAVHKTNIEGTQRVHFNIF